MIQRIQTLYLLISEILLAALYFLPFAEVIGKDEKIYKFDIHGYSPIVTTSGSVTSYGLPLTIVFFICVLLVLITVFQYRNRALQIKFCWTAILAQLVLTGLIILFTWNLGNILGGSFVIKYYSALPLFGIFFVYVAIKGIRRDELLIKSIDRIR